jgi:hypothetical protein
LPSQPEQDSSIVPSRKAASMIDMPIHLGYGHNTKMYRYGE